MSRPEQAEISDTLEPDWRRLAAGCVMIGATQVVALLCSEWISNHPDTGFQDVLPRLLTVLSITTGTALVFRVFFPAVWMTLIRGELERHQRGETWNAETLPAVSVFPAFALSLAGFPYLSPAAALYLFAVVILLTSMNSTQTLRQHVLRYSPGFGETQPTVGDIPRGFLLIVGLLSAALVPQTARPIANLQHVMLDAGLRACSWVSEAVANERSTVPAFLLLTCLFASAVALILAALCVTGIPLLMNVLVHAHLCGLQGHRLSVLREIAAVMTLSALCLALLGPAAIRCEAALVSLLGIATLKVTHREPRIRQYLQRMRQLR